MIGERLLKQDIPGIRDGFDFGSLKDYISLSIGADSIRVSGALFQREATIFREVVSALNLNQHEHELYISGEPVRNAYISSGKNHSQMVISTSLLSLLDDDELRFVIGHEFGHFLCQHSQIPVKFLVQEGDIPVSKKLQLLKWSRCAEISADRYGVLACGSLNASISALFKVAFGIAPPNLDSLRSSLRAQYENLIALSQKTKDQGNSDDFIAKRTHPLIPLRAVAIETTFMDVKSFGVSKNWNARSIDFIDNRLSQLIETMI